MTRIHHPVAHVAPLPGNPPAHVATPLALQGTLIVHTRASKIVYDAYGDQVTATPVSGYLSGVGHVRGTWDESVDGNGKYLGPDSIQLHNSKGSFVLGFDATTLSRTEQTAQGTIYPGATLLLDNGTGAYDGASTSGFLQENTNARHTVVTSLTLTGPNPA